MTRRYWKICQRLAGGVAVLALTVVVVLGGAYGIIQYDGNFHAVEPGLVFRSAQLDPDDLARRIKENGIRSILNLRGPKAGETWYDAEQSVATSMGVEHSDYGISANHPLTAKQMSEILQWIEHAPKPVLIHCQAGADRTGLVSALYLASRGASMERVREALSVRYGHFPVAYWENTRAMDESLDLFLSQSRLHP